MELIPSGIMDGKLSAFGQFDECLDIESQPNNGKAFYGKYCLAKTPIHFLHPIVRSNKDNDSLHENSLKSKYFSAYKLDNNLLKMMQAINLFDISYYRLGLCIPSTCDAKEIERAVNKSKLSLKYNSHEFFSNDFSLYIQKVLSPMKKQLLEVESECKVKNIPTKLNSYQRVALLVI
jgi:hypothetical protein